jgi:5-methylcytosine-specific restriction enzyme A
MAGGSKRLYKRKAWESRRHGLRWAALARDEFRCQACQRVLPSRELHGHHVIPHRGDERLFFDPTNITTLCRRCHATDAGQRERRGYSDALNDRGEPLDPLHPFNRPRSPLRGRPGPATGHG